MTEPGSVGAIPISRLIGDAVIHVEPRTSLRELAKVLADADVGAAAVVEGDDVKGVVSERDVVRALAGEGDPQTLVASDIASTEVVWCDAEASVAEVAGVMMDRYLRHVLIEDGGRLAGIVSARDLLGVYAAEDIELE